MLPRSFVLIFAALILIGCGNENDATFNNNEAGGVPGPPGTGGGIASVEGIPCEINDLLVKHCLSCHSDPPKFGAPMALTSIENIQMLASRIRERLFDTSNPMPPTGAMTDAERDTLDAWLADGAPPYEGPPCDDPPEPELPEVGPDALDCTPSHTFVAHADGSNDPYQVPEYGAENLYQCFTFKSPFDGVTQGTAWAPIIDDERVLHHWILYRTATPQEDGGVMPCNMPQDATFVPAWAPGGGNFEMPPDVGLELAGPDDYFILQIHYHNTAHYTDALDKSGVALCTVDTPRTYDAGIFTLGAVGINIPPQSTGSQAVGECKSWLTNFLPEPVHAIASFPHMHELGTSFRTEVFRGSDTGPREELVNIDTWVFDNQRYYEHSPKFTINPGDSIRTTCTYDNPNPFAVGFGEATEDEMCFNFVMLYPISLFDGNRSCGLL